MAVKRENTANQKKRLYPRRLFWFIYSMGGWADCLFQDAPTV